MERIVARTPAEVLPALRRVEHETRAGGYWAAGYVAYEAAAGIDPAMSALLPCHIPLVWFGIYERPVFTASPEISGAGCRVSAWQPLVEKTTYLQNIHRIKDHIRAGDTYQVNYTFPLRANFSGDPASLFTNLLEAQPGGFAALVECGDFTAVSVSPELFFRRQGNVLTSRPMKGTRPRGRWPADDRRNADALRESEKDRAENLMIVDMIRNDLGRIADVDSVTVPRLFDVERYRTVLQMTSTVRCTTESGFADIMAALFPCASITGAPKVSTMHLINALERRPRGLYTGSIGFVAPGGDCQFNVAIRTVQIDHRADEATYFVGGGIVWDSDAEAEYEECRTKAAVLTAAPRTFSLIETMRAEPGFGVLLQEHHLRRLQDSAAHFAFAADLDAVRRRLAVLAVRESSRVRLTIGSDGAWSLQITPMKPATGDVVRLAVANEPVNASDQFLYHKTTLRSVYDNALAGALEANGADAVDDVVLFNEIGLVTETSRANIAVKLGPDLVTPRREDGLLAGVLREEMLQRGDLREAPVALETLAEADAIFVISALRGVRRAVLTPAPSLQLPQHATPGARRA